MQSEKLNLHLDWKKDSSQRSTRMSAKLYSSHNLLSVLCAGLNVILFLQSLLILVVRGEELTFELPDSARQCFHQEIKQGDKCTFEFQVMPIYTFVTSYWFSFSVSLTWVGCHRWTVWRGRGSRKSARHRHLSGTKETIWLAHMDRRLDGRLYRLFQQWILNI